MEELVIPASLSFLVPTVRDDLIRLGSANDGGYVIPKRLLDETDFLISLGVNDDWSFDEAFRRLNSNAGIHAYDPSICRGLFVRRFVFGCVKACIGLTSLKALKKSMKEMTSYSSFFKGPVVHFKERIYNRVDLPWDTTLAKAFERSESHKVMLKVDIEGCEYRIIDDILQFADRISGVIIEFHDTDPLRPVFCAAVEKLRQPFEIVHVHANNYGGIAPDGLPEVLEITMIKKAGAMLDQKRFELPLPNVDSPNNPDIPDYQIRFAV